jgi:hypothetical protein
MNRHFEAPWGTPLKVVTGLTTGALVIVVIIGLANSAMPAMTRLMMVVIPPAGIVAGAFFSIRGYELTPEALLVQRLGWNSRIRLEGLRAVTVDAEATRRSFRSCGNGGFFAITGWFRNKKLGNYRLFGTDMTKTVVLTFDRRRVVVTPEDPETFARCLKEQAGLQLV